MKLAKIIDENAVKVAKIIDENEVKNAKIIDEIAVKLAKIIDENAGNELEKTLEDINLMQDIDNHERKRHFDGTKY